VLAEIALPARAVGRIPDHPGDSAASFAARIAGLCSPVPAVLAGPFYLLSAKVWERTTASMAAKLDAAAAVDVAPPRKPSNFRSAAFVLSNAFRHLYNLHGSDRAAPWFGQEGNRYPPAFDPTAVEALAADGKVQGALVVAQACYGAFLLMPGGPRRPSQACSLSFLEKGAAAFLGSTTIAYGGTSGPMVCSDVLAFEFLRAASEGVALGEALQKARSILVSSIQSPPAGSELKTLLQFVLYGDPVRAWTSPAGALRPTAKAFGARAEVDARARLAEYARWSEEETPTAKSPTRGGDEAAGGGGWTEIAHFSAPPAPEAKGASEGTRGGRAGGTRHVYQQVYETPAKIVYFRERVERDGTIVEAQSTGGRSAETIAEQREGKVAWWRQEAVAPAPAPTPSPKKKPRRRTAIEAPPAVAQQRRATGPPAAGGGPAAKKAAKKPFKKAVTAVKRKVAAGKKAPASRRSGSERRPRGSPRKGRRPSNKA
jgi:hypothetical protein